MTKPSQIKKYLIFITAFILYYALTNYFFGYISPTMILFGIPCPACGMSRAGLFFLQGNFADSFRMHPLFIPGIAFILVLGAFKIFWPDKTKHLQIPAIVLLVSFIAVFILRMVHLFPNYPPLVINDDSILHNILSLLRERN